MIDIEDIDSLLESQEKMVRGLRPGTEKKVLWALIVALRFSALVKNV